MGILVGFGRYNGQRTKSNVSSVILIGAGNRSKVASKICSAIVYNVFIDEQTIFNQQRKRYQRRSRETKLEGIASITKTCFMEF